MEFMNFGEEIKKEILGGMVYTLVYKELIRQGG